MTRAVLLDNVNHKDLKVNKTYRRGHGYDVNVARVFPSELARLQVEYPLFFVRNTDSGHFEAIALLGFADEENLYLGEGGWEAAVIPLTMERQPLLIGFQEQSENGVPTQVPVVHIDLDHPEVNETEGEPLFLPHGGESRWLERMSSVLLAIHEGHAASESLSQSLVGLELIESAALDIEFRDGSKTSLSGLYTINEEKLASLGGNALESLHRHGHLRSVFMMLASLPVLERLIERKNRRLQSGTS